MTNREIKPLDSLARSWVDGMPAALRPYLRLMRLDRPIGSWLLFWPSVFGLALGAALQHRAFLARGTRLVAARPVRARHHRHARRRLHL